MNEISNRLGMLYLKAKFKVYNFLHDENGDTNFLSIMIVMGIVLILAVVFMALRKNIVKFVQDAMQNFNSKNATDATLGTEGMNIG